MVLVFFVISAQIYLAFFMAKQQHFINREVSWLHFNERVLQEAMDITNPLIERLKFLGIFSNNRDEFFRVRVATLKRMLLVENTENEKLTYNPRRVLKEVLSIVEEQEKKFTDTFIGIQKDLKKEHIYFLDENHLTEEQGHFISQYFHTEVRSLLFPIMLKNLKSPDFLRNNSIYLAVVLSDSTGNQEEDFALIRVPSNQLTRFVQLPSKGNSRFLIMLDDVMRYSMGAIFSPFGYDNFQAYTIKFTRDAELDIDNDISKSFMELMSESVKKREKGLPVRFVYDKNIPELFLSRLLKKLNISETDTLRGGGKYHNFKDFMTFPKLGPPRLMYPKIKPLNHIQLPQHTSIFSVISQQDILLHYPYQSFQYLVDLLREAAIDPKVRAIKMTFYRAARDSNVINALINAARNGKEVTVFLEIQARFDEEANIFWAGKLRDAGVTILKTLPGYKVHAKLMLIRRKEEGENVYYTNISTGNFNETTAMVYTDISLLTANQSIAQEVNMLFHLFESPYNPPRFKHLLVAPYELRNSYLRLINMEMRHAKAGKEAWIILKLNNLVDKKIIRKLYAASKAGVKISIVCRGICVLRPGVAGLSDHIEVISIVDKFLEHSRVQIFANGGDPLYYLSSADWMVRNFDHRFEVSCPIHDENLKQEIMDLVQIHLADNVKARYIKSDLLNKYRKTDSDKPIRSQEEIYRYLKQLHRKKT